jgi:hypothetical protein
MHRTTISKQVMVILIGAVLIGGCIQEGPTESHTPAPFTKTIIGHVYLDGHAIGGARIEVISINGTDCVNTTTDDKGAYTLNINDETKYNLTAICQGLRHTVWPAYLPGETNVYDVNLTTAPVSTIEGSGYTIGPLGNRELFDTYDHKRWSGFVVTATSVKDSISITTLTDSNGSYSLEVEPNVLYKMTGAYNVNSGFSPMFRYRNGGALADGYSNTITVGPNETALVDYVFVMP